MKDYYEILGVPPDASKAHIKEVFRKLAHIYHPDKEGGNERKFKEINEAYIILSDDKKRADYDEYLKRQNQNLQPKPQHPTNEPATESTKPKSPHKVNNDIKPPNTKKTGDSLWWTVGSFSIIIIFIVLPLISLISQISNSNTSTRNDPIYPSEESGQDTENRDNVPIPPVEQKQPLQITNPNYLKNPSGYIVDYDGKVSEAIPLNQMLWVEDTYSDHAFTVSYVSEKLGTKFIGLGVIQIPGLGYPLKTGDLNADDFSGDPDEINKWKSSIYGQCWTQGTISFLETNMIHKAVYMVPLLESPVSYTKSPFTRPQTYAEMLETYRLLMDTPKDGERQDVSTFLVWNGYAVASESDFLRANPGLTAHNDMVKAKQKFRQELKDMEEVASLEGRGLWGTCKDSETKMY